MLLQDEIQEYFQWLNGSATTEQERIDRHAKLCSDLPSLTDRWSRSDFYFMILHLEIHFLSMIQLSSNSEKQMHQDAILLKAKCRHKRALYKVNEYIRKLDYRFRRNSDI